MKVVILAGGRGTRMGEQTERIPKPMVEIGGRPILWHLIKHYTLYGLREFIVAVGYRGDQLRRSFSTEPSCHIDFVDTGEETATAGRLLRLADRLGDGPFMLTYGDGLSTIDLDALQHFHRRLRRIATVSAVHPPARFGQLDCAGDLVTRFTEKASTDNWINGGFMVLEASVLAIIAGDTSSLEVDVLPRLAAQHQLAAFRHAGFWQCMDTTHDRDRLQALWNSGAAPWKLWTE